MNVSIIGNRPQLVKLVPELADVVIYTGQHYSDCLRNAYTALLEQCVVRELSARTIEEMAYCIGIELGDLRPDLVTVYGDTDSTLAGAIVGCRRTLVHVEAGLRCGNTLLPEERNRIVVDALADTCFCPTIPAFHNLQGCRNNVFFVGDIMQERLCEIWETQFDKQMPSSNGGWVITVHRVENSDSAVMSNLLKTVAFYVNKPRIFLHPKAKGLLDVCKKLKIEKVQGAIPYVDMLRNLWNCEGVITDSGGILREAAWLGKKCIVLRDECEFPEFVEQKRIKLVGRSEEKFRDALLSDDWGCRVELVNPNTTERILDYLGIPKRRECFV